MPAAKSIYQAVAEAERENRLAALCTVVRSQGSTPRRASSKMLVYPDGSLLGSVGGGEMESRVIAEARQAMQDGKPRFMEYNMSDPSRGDPGVCGGQMEIFVEPLIPKPTLVLVGAGHVGRAVVHLATGWASAWSSAMIARSTARRKPSRALMNTILYPWLSWRVAWRSIPGRISCSPRAAWISMSPACPRCWRRRRRTSASSARAGAGLPPASSYWIRA